MRATQMTPLAGLFAFLLAACAVEDDASPASSPGAAVEGGSQATSGEAALFELVVEEDGGVIATFGAPNEDGVLGRFIHSSGLTAGLGSNPVGLDRGLGDAGRIVAFRKVGQRVIIEEENWGYQASADNPDERKAVRDSFAKSILWSGGIEDGKGDDRIAVDISGFLTGDVLGIAGQLDRRGQGRYSLDKDRSYVAPEGVLVFPDNVEVDATMTFTAAKPGPEVSATAADGRAATLVQHHSFVRLPPDGYRPRSFDSRTGVIGTSYYDFSAPLAGQVRQAFARRFRLERVDPDLDSGPVKKPIIIYVDRGAPEPIRSALIDGASWWAEAFEAAGFEDAYRVEVLPEGVHPMDVRYNTIQWVHRQTRGWSYGGGVHDPRTGEMLKARVILGSQRVRQDRMIFEGLAGAEKTGSGEADDPIVLSLARIRQLSAHEVGHTLGFAHNFAASSDARASVMDYPAPFVRPADNGGLDFGAAYGVGVGPWDVFSTSWLYRQFPEGADEEAGLEAMVDAAYASGLRFVDDAQGRSVAAAHPAASVWDNGDDPVAMLAETLEVRARALAAFGERSLKPGEPVSRLRQVIAPIYLYHRYQTAAAAKLIGGYAFRHAEAGDQNIAGAPVPAERQRAALAALSVALSPSVLDLSDDVLNLLTPSIDAVNGQGEGEEHLTGQGGAMFDLLSAADAASALVFNAVLHPSRLARVLETHRRDPASLSVGEVFDTLDANVFGLPAEGRRRSIARAVQARYVSSMIDLSINGGAQAEVSAIVDARRLRDHVLLFLERRQVAHFVGDPSVLDLAIRGLDETELVDAREGRQRRDQTDVRSFRRLNRTNSPVVSRVHVANLETGALTRQTTGTKRRQASLVGDLGQRVGLVHELRQLARAVELLHHRRNRLVVDELLRHQRLDVLQAHALLDGALHADQPDAVLVFDQLTDRADAAIAEVVDVVGLTDAVLELDQITNDVENVFAAQRPLVERRVQAEAIVQLEAANPRQVVALRVEEQVVEERGRRLDGRRVARTQTLVDLENRILRRADLVLQQRIAQRGPDVDVLGQQNLDLLDPHFAKAVENIDADFLIAFEDDLAGLLVDDVVRRDPADHLLEHDRDFLDRSGLEIAQGGTRQLAPFLDDDLTVRAANVAARAVAGKLIGLEDLGQLLAVEKDRVLAVEVIEQVLGRHAEGAQQHRRVELATAVDADEEDVARVELEVDPRTAIRDDARRIQQLAAGVRLSLVVVEENSRRSMQLRDDDALGTVDHEGPVLGHQGNLPEVHFLLFDVLDRARAGLLVDVPDHELNRDLEGRRVGHAAFMALLHAVLRIPEVVADELQRGRLVEVLDREHRFEHALQAGVLTLVWRGTVLQKLGVRQLLNLDEIRNIDDSVDLPEIPPQAEVVR